jgi:hypothetical protein
VLNKPVDIRFSSPTAAPRSSAPSIFSLYGWFGILWMAGALISYLTWLFLRPDLRWNIAAKYTGVLLLPPLLATFTAQLPPRQIWKLPILLLTLLGGIIALWMSFFPDLAYLGWFFLWLTWVTSGMLLVDVLLFRLQYRVPLIVSASLFLGLVILLQYIFSVAHIANAGLLIMVVHTGLLVAGLLSKSCWRHWWLSHHRHHLRLNRVDFFFIALIITLMAFYLFVAQIPESASDVRVYLPKLRDFLLRGGYTYDSWNPFTYYPNGWYNLFFVPYAVGAEAAAKAFHVVISGVMLLGLYALAWRVIRNRTLALFATLIAYSIPMFNWLWYTLYQDATTLMFMLACATTALDCAAAPLTSKRKNILLFGVLSGLALLIKLTPLVGLAAMFGGLGISLFGRDMNYRFWLRVAWKPALLLAGAGILTICLCAPSWLPIWRLTGDPLFPAMTPLSDIGKTRIGLPNISWCMNPMTWALFPYFATFNSWMAIDYHLDGSLGPWLLMCWPFIPLNLIRKSPQRRFALIFAGIYWALIFLGHEFSARYHILFYMLFIMLGFAGIRIWLRHHRLLQLRCWSPLLLSLSALQLFLCVGLGLAVNFNFGQLRSFLAIQNRFLFNAKQWPDFVNLWDRLELLPEDASVAVTSNYGMMACQLPRHAFTFETMWLSRNLPQLGWDNPAEVLRKSGIALEILPLSTNPLRPSFFDWPQNVAWRRPSRLLYAGSSLLFAAKSEYAEPASWEFDIHKLAGLNHWGPLELQWGEDHGAKTLLLRLKDSMAGFSAFWTAPTTTTLELFEAGLNRKVPIQPALDMTPDTTRRFYRMRFATEPAALCLRTTQNWEQTSCTLAFFSRFTFPAQQSKTSRPTVQLPQQYYSQFNKTFEFENNAWFRSSSTPEGANQPGPISVCKQNWLAYRIHGAAGQKMQVYADLESTTNTTVHWDLRLEPGRLINQKIAKVIRRNSELKPGRQQVLIEFPILGENTPLTLLLWPECAKGELKYHSGLVNFIQ